jgi:radical SAM superfamily enzyme YgiQ (UPF0313 family)
MYFDHAEGMVFRPPSEANSLILRVTIGCAHNKCTFCAMYRDVQFRIRPIEEITALITKASAYYPKTRRIFLADGDALVLHTDKLLKIMHLLHECFPLLTRITCYAGPKDILRKTPEELAALKAAGLKIIYLGIESGDDEVLANVKKAVTSTEMINAGQKVISSGIKLSAMLILGLGGKERTRQHALHSAAAINAIKPTMLSTLSLMLTEGTPLRAAADHNEFHPLSPFEILQELKTMMENFDLTAPCIFRSNHVSNFLPLAGTLPKDKEKLLQDINLIMKQFESKTSPTYNIRATY